MSRQPTVASRQVVAPEATPGDASRLFRASALAALSPEVPRSVLRVPGLSGWRPRRVPVVRQTTESDCGVACLTMVLGALGRNVGFKTVREAMGIQRDGVDVLTIVIVSGRFGVEAEGVRAELVGLHWTQIPAVLHWGFNHSVVLVRARKDCLAIVGLSAGRRSAGMAEAERLFTGVTLVFETKGECAIRNAWVADWRHYVRKVFTVPRSLAADGLLMLGYLAAMAAFHWRPGLAVLVLALLQIAVALVGAAVMKAVIRGQVPAQSRPELHAARGCTSGFCNTGGGRNPGDGCREDRWPWSTQTASPRLRDLSPTRRARASVGKGRKRLRRHGARGAELRRR